MRSILSNRLFLSRAALIGAAALSIAGAAVNAKPPAQQPAKVVTFAEHGKIVSSPFQGPKANTGTVAVTHENGKCVLALSDDFKVPDAPAPHWQIVDSKGNTYLLNRLKIKGEKYNQSISVPGYIDNIAKVQIRCAFAEANLGEASFTAPVSNK